MGEKIANTSEIDPRDNKTRKSMLRITFLVLTSISQKDYCFNLS